MKTYKPKYSFDIAKMFRYAVLFNTGTHLGEVSYSTNSLKGAKKFVKENGGELRRIV